jgi:hypothetical protein
MSMLNELRDLDGEVVARARVIESASECFLILCNTETGVTLRLDGLETIAELRNICDEILLAGAEE